MKIDKKVLKGIAKGDYDEDDQSIIKHNCDGKRCKLNALIAI